MKPFRVAMLIVAVLAVGLSLVILRHSKAEVAYEIHQLHAEQLILERQMTRHQAAVAAEQRPDELSRRVEQMRLPLEPPEAREPAGGQ